MRRKSYKAYPREFKLEAIRLAEVGDKTASQVARELGLRVNQIWKWKQQLEREATAGGPAKRGRPADDEVRRLWRASQVAGELGLRVNQIWKWKQQLEREATAGGPAKRGRPADDEVARLRRE